MRIFYKKSLTLLLVILLSAGLILSGCGQQQNDQVQEPDVEQEQQEKKAPENTEVILSTTTSTRDSGLLDVLIPIFEKKTGYKVKPIAVGTGKALAMGESGDADVLLVHAPEAEMEYVEKGAVMNRQLIMHNDFIVLGPKDDPAGIKDAKDSTEALKKIAEKKATFISRGDDSGTHKKELGIWKKAGIEEPEGEWYKSTGQGMGATLDVASELGGYTLSDRGTYLSKMDKLELEILTEGDAYLLNIYHVMQVNPEYIEKNNPSAARLINTEGAKAFVEFMIDNETQNNR